MKPSLAFPISFFFLALAVLLFSACSPQPMPETQSSLLFPIEFVFENSKQPNLLGTDIAYLGSAPSGSVYQGIKEENASLVVLRWSGIDYFFSLKGFDIKDLQTVLCKVECNIKIELVEGTDLLAEVISLDVAKPLSEPQVVWESAAQPTPVPTECVYVPFKKGATATILVPLKMRSTPEIPENFNENVLSYMAAGEKVEVVEDSQADWIHIKKVSGESGYSKQCSTLYGRFINP